MPQIGGCASMVRVVLQGVHRVKVSRKAGPPVEYHYAWRGGPRFWRTGDDCAIGSPAYLRRLEEHVKEAPTRGTFSGIIRDYLSSGEWRKLSPRTQADYSRWIERIDARFGTAPIESFNRPAILAIALKWRDGWSGRQADYAWTVLVRLVSWAKQRKILEHHQLLGIERLYEADRSEIIWTDPDRAAFRAAAPAVVADAFDGACETGLRPGDLVNLSRAHIQKTPRGRRIKMRTSKRGRVASIPVTPLMAEIIDRVPSGQLLIFLNSHGGPWDEKQLSKQVTAYRRKAKLDENLRLYDARGTACTKLLMAGATLQEIAVHMGWSVKTAAEMIEIYARLDPSVSDAILVKLAQAKSGTDV